MKKITFLLSFIALYGCQRQQDKVTVRQDTFYQKAESFLDRQNDSAFYYYNKSANNAKDSLQVAMAYGRMSQLQSDAGDYFGSQETLSMSLKFLSEHEPRNYYCLSADYNELGNNSIKLRNYDQAIAYYDQAMRFIDDREFHATISNNKGNAFQKKRAYDQAISCYQTALSQSGPSGRTYARIITNLAMTRWLKNPAYRAAPELLRALRIRQSVGDTWGENSSFVHLAEYYTLSKPDSALFYARNMYAVATKLNSPDDRLEALQQLIQLVPGYNIKSYFYQYQALNDSLRTARSAARNQFALIRYDTEKNKADNLRLQRDNTEKRYQLTKQRILLYGAAILFIAALFWYRNRKQHIWLEAQHIIKENELKFSKKVHDVVANGLYQVMKEVQYQVTDKEQLVDKIDHLYRQSRDISYEIPRSTDDFPNVLNTLLQSFATDTVRVLLVGNSAELWKDIHARVRSELVHVLRELMVNMDKHSQARNVVVKFVQDEQYVRIVYTDDGKGMEKGSVFGNGLTNTGNRIRSIGGSITFEPNGARGLRVSISFPIAYSNV